MWMLWLLFSLYLWLCFAKASDVPQQVSIKTNIEQAYISNVYVRSHNITHPIKHTSIAISNSCPSKVVHFLFHFQHMTKAPYTKDSNKTAYICGIPCPNDKQPTIVSLSTANKLLIDYGLLVLIMLQIWTIASDDAYLFIYSHSHVIRYLAIDSMKSSLYHLLTYVIVVIPIVQQ